MGAWFKHILNSQQAGEASSDTGTFLLHGVTGSGKTEIYIRAAEHALAQGRDAIILVPEIALTTQMVARFMGRFGEQVGLIHSTLSSGERYDTWRRARHGGIYALSSGRGQPFLPAAFGTRVWWSWMRNMTAVINNRHPCPHRITMQGKLPLNTCGTMRERSSLAVPRPT